MEKSTDCGKTWSVWQYFVKDSDDCELLGVEPALDENATAAAANVVCSSQQYVKNRPIAIDLLNNHQLITNNVKSEVLDEWTRTTSVRLHFYGLKIDLKYFPLLKNPNITENVSCSNS